MRATDPTKPNPTAQHRSVDDAWRNYGPPALRFATVLVGPTDAHDIVTNAFLRVADWQSIDHPQTYLLRAVRNEAQNHHRHRTRQRRRDLAAVPDAFAANHESNADIVRALKKLTLRQRSIIFLAYWEDMTEAAIADTLDLSTGTVHRTLSRARHQIRRDLS